MTVARMVGLAMTGVLGTACHENPTVPEDSILFAAATFECGPADGPATAIYLMPEPVGPLPLSGAFVRVYVPVGVDHLTGRWTVSDGITDAAGWFHSDDDQYEPATGGSLDVTAVNADNSIEGVIDLHFDKAGHLKGPFKADWRPPTVVGCF